MTAFEHDSHIQTSVTLVSHFRPHGHGAPNWYVGKLPVRRDGNLCYGPGIADMKGGNYLALEAIRQLATVGAQTPLPITVLFTQTKKLVLRIHVI